MINFVHKYKEFMEEKVNKIFFLLCLIASMSQAVKAQSVKEPTNVSALQDTFWSLSIQDASTGGELVGIRSHHLMTPASTMKVVSTATALSIYPVSTRFETRIETDGEISNGVLNGNVYVIGDGDPSIGSRYFWREDAQKFFKSVAAALKEQGISKVTGGVVAISDKRDFQAENPRWPLYDLGNHYAAGAFNLNLFDNSYTARIVDSGQRVIVEPEVPELKLTTRFAQGSSRSRDSLYISRIPLSDGSFPITGVYPSRAKSITLRGSVPNPPLFVASNLQHFLRNSGVSFGANASTQERSVAGMKNLYTFKSPTILELARITNVYSHNLFAEGFLRLVGRDKVGMEGHNLSQTAIMEVMRYWSSRGLDVRELEMLDGSGLSGENRVTANFLASLLGKVYRSEMKDTFMRTLPRAGVEGTVTSFLKRTPLEGKAYLKSGTIRNVVCYTGYVELDGKVYTVAFMVNNFYGRASNIRGAMESILLESFGLK